MSDRVVEIRDDLKSDFQRLALLVGHHEQLAQEFRDDLHKLVKIGHGVDLHEPGWMLDIISGRVFRHEVEQPAPEPEQEGA